MRRAALITICFAMIPVAFSSSGFAAPSTASMARQQTRSPAAQAKPRPPRVQPHLLQACRTPTQVTPTVGGKYQHQVRRVLVPTDCASYGPFNDYGYYPITSYGGQRNIPAGYWVYHYPYWHVFQQKRVPSCQTPRVSTPSVAGRYWGLIRRMSVPADCATYGAFREYGHYPATSYAGHYHLPSGYWVYHYPNWYLWRNRRP